MCRKVKYRDMIAAKLQLAKIQWKDKSHRPDLEQRAYKCPHCRGYHLTHKAKESV